MKIGKYTIDKEGYKIIRMTFLTIVIFFLLYLITGIHGRNMYVTLGLVVLSLIAMFIIIRFFRVPDRPRIRNSNAVFSPADGTVVAIEKVFVDEYLKKEQIQVSVFMSIWNVHANWYPVSGKIEYVKYHPGKFLVANNPKSSTLNERATIVVNHDGESIMFRQIAGFVARRIVCYAKVGEDAEQNEKCGFIKLGSRLDVFIPLDYEIKVKLGDKVIATESMLAEKPQK